MLAIVYTEVERVRAAGGQRMSSTPQRPTESFTAAQASALLGVEPDTLAHWTDEGTVRVAEGQASGERKYTLEELERVRREVMYPEVVESHGGFILRAHHGVSDDGRFGRCWYHVFRSEEDQRADRRLFSVVLLVHHMWTERRGRPLDIMALQEARRLVHAMLDRGSYEPDKLYRKVIGREGIVRDIVEELRDNVYR
jgi:hypothetical protein